MFGAGCTDTANISTTFTRLEFDCTDVSTYTSLALLARLLGLGTWCMLHITSLSLPLPSGDTKSKS